MNSNIRQAFATGVCTLLLFLAVAYTACNKPSSPTAPDNCANVTCKNGGTCIQGLCSCPNGFEDNDCGTRSIARYIGNWNVQETITGSSKADNKGVKNLYKMSIREVPGSTVRFTISNFMGKATDSTSCELGQKYNAVTKSYERDLPTNYVIRANQVVNGTYITIISGAGRVDGFGSSMVGTYHIVYPTITGVVNDTISYTAS